MQKTLSVIDLRAVRANALKIRPRLNGKRFYAVVKADGYGHGAEEVARALSGIADGFCVAITQEGAALRVAGVREEILVLTPPLGYDDIARAKLYNLTLSVNSVKTAHMCSGLPVHIQVNTGMNRMGCNLSDLPAILKSIDPERLKGVYSHLYAPQDGKAAGEQLKIFDEAERLAKGVNSAICAHLSASGGFLRGGKFLKEGVRCGILLYGYPPSGFKAQGFSPALKVYARKVQDTKFIGGGAGYAAALKNYDTVTCFRSGYADGFERRVPLGEGNLCMDSFIKDGWHGNMGELICVMDNAESYAERCGTICYEVLTSVTRRSERVYIR